jgi:hypothetical protein
VGAYDKYAPTRQPRLAAAADILGVDLSPLKYFNLDIFLVPPDEEARQIPAWNDPQRSFYAEMMSGLKLT